MSRLILHVDMDAFFASIEQLDHPSYRGKPVVVGADPLKGKGRGVVSTCSYEARVYGIHSAMPISQAYKLCPQAIYVFPRMERYIEIASRLREIFTKFSPAVEPISIDEAFLDCTGMDQLFGSSYSIASSLQSEIKKKLQLTASVGVASNKFIAKVCSDLKKPNGITVCPAGKEIEFLAPLEVGRLWGAGKKTVQLLHSYQLYTIGDVASCDPLFLKQNLGKSGLSLYYLSRGIDHRPVEGGGMRKSMSEEHTFMEDVSDELTIVNSIYYISEELMRKLRGEELKARTLTLKIRLEGFVTFTRSQTFRRATSSTRVICDAAIAMFRLFHREEKKVRLIGLSLSNLEFPDKQLDLFEQKKEHAEVLLDDLKNQFGDKVQKARFFSEDARLNSFPDVKQS